MNLRTACAITLALLSGCAVDRKVMLHCKGECLYDGAGSIEAYDPTVGRKAVETPLPKDPMVK